VKEKDAIFEIKAILKFPTQNLIDYESCYQFLSNILHSDGLRYKCGQLLPQTQPPHKYCTNVLPCFKCCNCASVYNIFTGTILSGIHYDCVKIVLML